MRTILKVLGALWAGSAGFAIGCGVAYQNDLGGYGGVLVGGVIGAAAGLAVLFIVRGLTRFAKRSAKPS